MGWEVTDIYEPLFGCGASQPACHRSQHGRSSVPTDGQAGVPSLPPDICGYDDGAADGHHHLPPHHQQTATVSDIIWYHIQSSPLLFLWLGGKKHEHHQVKSCSLSFMSVYWTESVSLWLKDENRFRCEIKSIVPSSFNSLMTSKGQTQRWRAVLKSKLWESKVTQT